MTEEGTYTVRVGFETWDRWQYVTRVGVARQSISFVDLPYSTDIHLVKAFRHPLGIPEEIMPDAWKNSIASTDTDPTLEGAFHSVRTSHYKDDEDSDVDPDAADHD
jgi:hypothetical protein